MPGVTVIVGGTASALISVAVKIAATASNGACWPDNTRATAGDVTWLSTQPDPDGWFRPKFETVGADLQRIHFIAPMKDDFGLPIRHFAKDLRRLGDTSADGTTLIIDCLSDYLGVDDVETSVNSLGKAITALKELAAKKRVAVLALCQTPTRNDRHVSETAAKIGLWSDVQTVLRVMRAEKPNRGVLLPLVGEGGLGFPFQLRQNDGVLAVVWDAIAADLKPSALVTP